MFLFKRILIIFFLIIPISNSSAAMVTEVDSDQAYSFLDGGGVVNGIAFNPDGTKMFVSRTSSTQFIIEYNLSTPFDISAATYAGDAQRCELGTAATLNPANIGDMVITSDGLKMFFVQRSTNGSNNDRIYRYDLTAPYDISTCVYVADVDPDTDALAGTSFGGRTDKSRYHVQGIEINTDGTKIFLSFNDVSSTGDGIKEYNLSTPYDLATMSLITSGGIDLANGATGFNPDAIFFSANGKRIFVTDHSRFSVAQYSLSKAYDTSSNVKDGEVVIRNLITTKTANQTRALAFSTTGLKMFVSDDNGDDSIHEFDLVCPFNIIAGKCPPITENSVRTGIAEAQIMIAKRTIDHSTKSALNRLEWIRRNKDNQNLTNLNFNFNTATQLDNPLLNYWVKKLPDRILSVNEKVEGGQSITINKEDMNSKNSNNFTTVFKSDNPMLNSWLSKIPDKITAYQASIKKKTEDKQQDIFYWSEGSISVGRVGDTNISSFKKIGTEAITLGADKFTDNNGIKGWAFRLGNNNVDVGMGGSNIDTDTFNLTYYSTTPLENDTKSEDIVIGFGKLKYDILTVLDGKHMKASRDGRQIYGAVKSKDEIKKNNFILIPSFQADIGHTILYGYTESGTGAIKVKDQHIQTLKLRTAMGVVDDLPNETTFCLDIAKTCAIKRHGKLEYMADLRRSSNFKYAYASDSAADFQERLYSGALHNVNGEVGIDIILPDSLSVFLIYERNQALGSGHTDNIIITIGYLPNKQTNYAFKVAGSDNIGSEYKISKNINDFEIDFKLNNQDVLKPNTIDEAMINLSRIF
ncbi:autotransporter domain-containing protein [Candidatus Pelagibacter sp. Uisw_137]|uniref:autotransporter domain-containing protein n=1 Tax=Candidatus Pelagibacter sp. Uisw_137 TaxID=3230992 RepID=UPI0039EA8AB9